MKVEILNPDTLRDLYKNHGQFACICYDTPEEYAERVGKSCQESGHVSGSRCEYIKFRVSDIDRGTAEQCLRHEIGTFVPFEFQDNYSFSDYMEIVDDVSPDQIVKNMASFRYIDKDGFDWATPANIARIPEAKGLYDSMMKAINYSRRSIKEILERNGVDPRKATEDANMMLPRATTSSFVIGMTPEALLRWCQHRLCTRAQEFIRELARLIVAEIKQINPEFASECVPKCKHLLWCPEGKHSCGAAPTKAELCDVLKRVADKPIEDPSRASSVSVEENKPVTKKGRRSKRADELPANANTVYKLYMNDDITIVEASKLLHVSRPTTYRWFEMLREAQPTTKR